MIMNVSKHHMRSSWSLVSNKVLKYRQLADAETEMKGKEEGIGFKYKLNRN